jgi:hypothetical protein
MGKYGTNLEGFGAFEGGVNADKGAPLVSTSSDGETALLFGPAALREIQAGVANGDFAIPPDAAGDAITDENPLPYWTWTPATGITAAIVADSGSGSGNVLRVTVAAGTYASTTLGVLSRIIPVATSRARDSVYVPLVSLRVASGAEARFSCTYQYLTQVLTNTGTAMSRAITQASSTITTYAPDVLTNAHTPADAAYLKISISIGAVAGTYATNLTADLCEVRVISGNPFIYLANKQTPAAAPGVLEYTTNGLESSIPFYTTAFGTEFADLRINTGGDAIFDDNVQVGIDLSVLGDTSLQGDLTVTGSIGLDGLIYFDSALTGPSIILGGTNGRLWAFSNSSGSADLISSNSTTRAGVLITKPTAGQPSTNINGTATTDAFSDALRNGGIAVDTTNNRAYFYSAGWKYAALTTPSDSRLKEEITEISGALDTLRQLVPVAFKWKRPEAHGRAEAVDDDGTRLGFIADQVATTDLKHWVETLGVDEREADLVDTDEVLAVNIPQNEMEALVVQALLDIDTRLKALESR